MAWKWLTYTAVTASEACLANFVSLTVTNVVPHFIVLWHAKCVTILSVVVLSTYHTETERNCCITIGTTIGCWSGIPTLTLQEDTNGEGIHQVIRTEIVNVNDLNVNLCSTLYLQWMRMRSHNHAEGSWNNCLMCTLPAIVHLIQCWHEDFQLHCQGSQYACWELQHCLFVHC